MYKYLILFAAAVLPIYSSTETIAEVLEICLAPTDQSDYQTNAEIIEIRTCIINYINANDYGSALDVILMGVKRYPHCFFLQTQLATVLGDHAGNFSGQEQEKMLQKSKEIFSKLLLEVDGQVKRSEFYFRNEYCYRFALHKEQYENGLANSAYTWDLNQMGTYGRSGYYCQGVGAANYAKQLLLNGEKELAYDYAIKALLAWSQYFSYYNIYYNAYVHYGLALGILGYKDEMMKALQRGAELIHTDLNYHEFKEVINFFDGALGN